ncbi:MAG TPA: hypothetical protein VK070_09875 [Acidimicrobiia bacterium]|jgi:hypothetical protein|nr:hypothetical protein [Acidimicrobiia bacterium]
MELLVGTAGGVFDETGRPLSSSPVVHLARRDDAWWAVGPEGLIRNGRPVTDTPNVTLNCVLPTEHTVWVGGSNARLFRLEAEELREETTFLGAPGRDKWHTPWGGPPDIRSMSEASDGVVYVNVHVGGILRFDDSGFVPTVDIESDVHQVVAHPTRPEVAATASARGWAVTVNGHDFEFNSDGLTHTYCRAVALDGDTIWVSASRGPRGGDARLFRGNLAGTEVEPVSGLPVFDGNLDTHCVLANGGFVFVGHGPEVWGSTDSGASWELLLGDLPDVTCLA